MIYNAAPDVFIKSYDVFKRQRNIEDAKDNLEEVDPTDAEAGAGGDET